MVVTLINPFVVPAELDDAEFVRRWREAAEELSHAPGFIETHLHQNTGAVDNTFRFINIARWESVEAYHAAQGFTPNAPHEHGGAKFYPGLFTPVVDVKPGL